MIRMISGFIKYAIIIIAIIAVLYLAHSLVVRDKKNSKHYSSKKPVGNKNKYLNNQSINSGNNSEYYREIIKEYPAAEKLDDIIKKSDMHDGDIEIIYETIYKNELRSIYVAKYIVLSNMGCKFNIYVNDHKKSYEMISMGLSEKDCAELRFMSLKILNSNGVIIAANKTRFLLTNYQSIIIRTNKTEKEYSYNGEYTIANIMDICDKQLFDTCKTNILLYTMLEKLKYTGSSLCYAEFKEK